MAESKKRTGKSSGSGNGKRKAGATRGNTLKPIGSRVKDEIWAILIMALGAFLVVALQTEAAGIFGAMVATFLKGSFGFIAFILPYYLIIYGILLFANKTVHIDGKSVLLIFIVFLMLTLLNSVRYIDGETFSFSFKGWNAIFDGGAQLKNGGFFGMMTGAALTKIIGKWGLCIFAGVVIAISLLLVINTPVSQFFENMKEKRAQKSAMAEQLLLEAEKDSEKQGKITAKQTTPTEGRRIEPLPKEPPLHSAKMVAAVDRPSTAEAAQASLNQNRNGLSQGQMKILTYMKDEDLFDKADEGEKGFGLEDHLSLAPGFGLAGNGQEKDVALAGSESKEKKMTSGDAAKVMLEPEDFNLGKAKPQKPYEFPSVEYLNRAKVVDKGNLDQILQQRAMKLEQTLQDFHVDARVIKVTQGPAVTRYEIQPNVGVKVSSIVRLADDIALNLEAKSIRIEAPIPGKAAVGIEVENERINMVTLREIIDSKEFKGAKSKITFAVGKDISGNSIVADLKGMPHLLIAGSTGSGKSVCINSIITSILYKSKPEEVKLVLIDPKVVELGNYNGIPHLLIPVVTEPSKAAAALNWAVAEMTDRYKKFAEEGVRDLESFNATVKKKKEDDRFLAQIVIIIDELADLMMAAPAQVEESICRLAQMARAAGMHLIVATQRPSVDIITGVIKANIPSRIAFAVSSQFDSRTILDMGGAEKLVGKGDMLFNPLGMGKPIRVQGCFISDSEVHNVIEHVKAQVTEVEYSSDVIHTIDKGNTQDSPEDADELLAEAIETVVKSGQASVSMVQRRFRVGYNRAARIVDMMEARGVIGPADGSRPRQVLMTEDELSQLGKDTEDIK